MQFAIKFAEPNGCNWLQFNLWLHFKLSDFPSHISWYDINIHVIYNNVHLIAFYLEFVTDI